MNVLVLGGTGFIGSAIVERLLAKGADVAVLCRNESSCQKAEELNAAVVKGDVSQPEAWLSSVDAFDAVVHAACGFGRDMAEIDTQLTKALISHLSSSTQEKTFIYTGGTWCYGDNGGNAITEQTPYAPMPEFNWMVDSSKRVQLCKSIRGMTIHPAIVVDDPQGIPELLLSDFSRSGELSIPCSYDLHWPIVDRYDLADAYYLALEGGIKGQSYNIAGIESASVLAFSSLIAKRYKVNNQAIIKPIAYWVGAFGELSKGYAYSQSLVSAKARDNLGWEPLLRDNPIALL